MGQKEEFKRLVRDLQNFTEEETHSLDNANIDLTEALLDKKQAILERLKNIHTQDFNIDEHPDIKAELTDVLTKEKQNSAQAKALLQGFSEKLDKIQKTQANIKGFSKTYANNYVKNPPKKADYKA